MSSIQIRRTGDWNTAKRLLRTLPLDIRRVVDDVAEEEAKEFVKKAQKAFDTSGGSNNARWPPLKRTTLQTDTGSNRPLMDAGSLQKSMHVKKVGRGKYAVAFRGVGGVGAGEMTRRAMTHEKGAVITQRVSQAQFKAVMAKLRESGSRAKGKGTFRPGAIMVVRIPRRSFLEDTRKAHFSGAQYKHSLVSKIRRKLVKYTKLF